MGGGMKKMHMIEMYVKQGRAGIIEDEETMHD